MAKQKDTQFKQVLSRLFSNDIIISKLVNNKLQVIHDVEKEKINNSTLLKTNNNNNSNPFESNSKVQKGNLSLEHINKNRFSLYQVYENMDEDATISSALDIYADEIVNTNENGEMLTITSDDELIKEALVILFNNTLQLNLNLWGWARGTVKYGDQMVLLDIQKDYGVVGYKTVNCYYLERKFNEKTNRYYYVKTNKSSSFNKDEEEEVIENYNVLHFKLYGDNSFFPYGKSILYGAKKHFEALSMMEDALLISRLTRAPEKRVFKIDVGNLKPAEAEAYVNRVKNQIRKVPLIDPKTGNYNLKFNMINMLEDFFVTKRGDKYSTEIDTLPGLTTGDIEDLEYFRNKVLSSFKIPGEYLSFSDGATDSPSLSSKDGRFAKTIERIQNSGILPELYSIAYVHLYALGFSEDDILNFKLSLNSGSILREMEKMELISQRFSLIRDIQESKMFDNNWIYENIFDNLSEEQIDEMLEGIAFDKRMLNMFEQLESEGEYEMDLPTRKFKKSKKQEVKKQEIKTENKKLIEIVRRSKLNANSKLSNYKELVN